MFIAEANFKKTLNWFNNSSFNHMLLFVSSFDENEDARRTVIFGFGRVGILVADCCLLMAFFMRPWGIEAYDHKHKI